MATITGGAVLMSRREKIGGPSNKMQGYLDLDWHGAHDGGSGKHRESFVSLPIAKDVVGGQFDLMFCSTKCLRAFLNVAVDELERRMRKSRTFK